MPASIRNEFIAQLQGSLKMNGDFYRSLWKEERSKTLVRRLQLHEFAVRDLIEALGGQIGWPDEKKGKTDTPERPAMKFTEDNCPGHVASEGNSKICGRCGTHIDSLRPPEREL